jgi:cytoskeletal protein RodZ
MNTFSSSKINEETDTIAQQLKQTRQNKEISLKNAAKNLGINQIYLSALESGNFSELPPGIYGKNYLRQYAEYLGLNPDNLLKVFNQEVASMNNSKAEDNPFSRKTVANKRPLTIPKLIKNIVILSIVLAVFIYLGFYLNNVVSPPQLEILYPKDNLVITEKVVEIRGVTEPEAQIDINGEAVMSNEYGFFGKKINLKTGVNLITITSQKKYGRKQTLTKQILVKND